MTFQTNIATNPAFVVPSSERRIINRSHRLWKREDLWLKKRAAMKHWFWFDDHAYDDPDDAHISQSLRKWCCDCGIQPRNFIIDIMVRWSGYDASDEDRHAPEYGNDYYPDCNEGKIGFLSQDDADLFTYAWVEGNRVTKPSPTEKNNANAHFSKWHDWWKEFYANRPLPISPLFSDLKYLRNIREVR